MSYWIIFAKIFEVAGWQMCKDCQKFIEKKSKILDLGCGSGLVGKIFQDYFQADVRGVDVKDWRVSSIPFHKIDGLHLPFPEKSFDTTLINYVLHHSADPVGLLREAKRVTKGNIVIYEDLSEGFISKWWCKMHSGLTVGLLKHKNKPSFKTEEEWKKIFEKLGLKTIFQKGVNFFPAKRELFICRA